MFGPIPDFPIDPAQYILSNGWPPKSDPWSNNREIVHA